MNQINKIPVTVVTGFLGAGKTTFINDILKEYASYQFALVENEFGDVAIDTKLIKGVDASQMFEMRQGCICCTITDEYELVLQELADRFPNVQHLLIETTGLADPAPVIRPFFHDENLKGTYRFNGTICLVDALNFDDQPEKEITIKQIAVADLILINKSEGLSSEQKAVLEKELKEINPLATIFFSEFGRSREFDLNQISGKIVKPEYPVHRHSFLETKTLTFDSPLHKDDFIRRITYMLDINKKKVYRAKGILNFYNEPYEFILQGVGGSLEIVEGESFNSGGKSEIVLIGKLTDADLSI
ncbi:MAG TPA: GTP-binding protein [Prolixibacteraceae bacterium]|nr:GTP-binding protein [Prolixibacteraceae bacterium]